MISAFQSANAVVVAAKSAYGLVMTVMQQPAHGVMVAREAAFPALAIVAIVASADIRIPLGLPGHRGLVWLTVLVAVTLLTRRRETVVVVGAASTLSAAVLDAAGPWMSGRYLAAAMLLYAAAAIPAVRGRPWWLSGAAAPFTLSRLPVRYSPWGAPGRCRPRCGTGWPKERNSTWVSGCWLACWAGPLHPP